MKLYRSLFAGLCLLAASCRTDRVLVRFRNDSPEDFRKLNVKIFDSAFHFQNIESGRHTRYIKVRNAYPYCSMEVITYRDTLRLLPAVYLDKQLIRRGKLIMSVTIKPYRYKKKRLLDISTKHNPF